MAQLLENSIPNDEHIYYEYSPTFGSNLVPHCKIDPRFSSYKESGVGLKITIRVVNLRILVILVSSDMRQIIEIDCEDLIEIRPVDRNIFSSGHGVKIIDSSGMKIHLASTRPQVVALDLWNAVCTMLIVSYGSKGHIRRALTQITKYNISLLCVPDDYYDLRKDSLPALINIGFSYPVNGCPTINHRLCADAVDTWYQAQHPDKSLDSVLLPSKASPPAEIQSNSSKHYLYLSNSLFGSGPWLLRCWLVDHGQEVTKGQPLVRIWRYDRQIADAFLAGNSGTLQHLKDEGTILKVGDMFGVINSEVQNSSAESSFEPNEDPSLAAKKSLACLPEKKTTSEALRVGALSAASGSIPQFQPSVACEPIGFPAAESPEQDFIYALSNHRISFQSFFNDVDCVAFSRINDDVIGLPCFDEALYCALVREMHRYSLAEIADNKVDLANKNAGLGAMVGSLLGLISGNIFAPFLGHSYGKNISDRSRRVEEFLPDPNLLFYQDENSYLSWSKAQVSAPRLRRLIFDRRVKADGNVFFRLIPAIVTADSVFPIQLFKIDSSTYFYRPFSAGIERNQPHYDSVKIQRRYFHLRGEGSVSETDMKVCVSGRDVEEYKSKIFRFQGSSLDYFYLDFKTSPGSIF